ncbi:MAG: ankyrin repeat domain-containing protein [Thermodesulfovibrionales bacterium]|nr:ankyrin repeat domain-containing protein [Thermodesulfovibrionales bacterium]
MNETELIKASRIGDADRVQQLLASGANVEDRDEHGHTSLHIAADAGNIEVVKLLVAHGAQINAPTILYGTAINYTPVSAATSRGHLEVTKHLSENGAILYERDGYMGFFSVMLGAAASGNLDIVKYLHEEKKLPVNEADGMGVTPLNMAIEKAHEHIVAYLFEHGADPNKKIGSMSSAREYVRERLVSNKTTETAKTNLRVDRKEKPPMAVPAVDDLGPRKEQRGRLPMSWLRNWLDMRKARSLVKKDEWGREADFLIEDHSKESKKLVLDHLTTLLPILEGSLAKVRELPEADFEAARVRVEFIRNLIQFCGLKKELGL